MKATSLYFAAFALMALASCKKETTTAETGSDTTIVVTPPPPAVETPAQEDTTGTSVEAGADGIKVDTKNPDGSTKVEVTGEKAKVEIK